MARTPVFAGWRRKTAAVALLAAGAAAAAVWFAGTEAALRLIAGRAVQAGGGRLALEDVRGSLYGRIGIGRFAFDDDSRRIDGQGLAFDWSLRELLFRRKLLLHGVALQALEVNLVKAADEPAGLPQALRLPLALEIRGATIDSFVLSAAGRSHEFRGIGLALDNPPGRLHVVLSAETPWGKAEADLTLGDAPPFTVNGRIGLRQDGGEGPYAANATLEGTLAEIAVAATGSFRDARAELQAAMTPLERRPLKQAALRVSGVDAQKFHVGLPRTEIAAELNLRAQGVNAVSGDLGIRNAMPGSLDASLLPLREAQARFEGWIDALSLTQVRLDLGNAGRFSGKGKLGPRGIELAMDTSAFNLRGIHATLLPTKLAGRMEIDALGETQDLRADLREGGHRVRIDASRAGGTLQLRAGHLAVAGGELNLSGAMAMTHAREFTAEGRVSKFDPGRLGNFPAAAINGSFAASGRLAPAPEALLQFTVTDSRYRGHRVNGKGRATLSPGRIRDGDVALEAGGNRLALRGSFGTAGDSIEWQFDGGNLAVLAAGLGGRLSASGSLQGSLEEPSGRFRAQGRNLAWGGAHRIGDFSAEASLTRGMDGPLELTAALRIQSAAVAAKGRRGEHTLSMTAKNESHDARAEFAGGWLAGRGWSGRILAFENLGRHAAVLEAPASLATDGAAFALAGASLRIGGGRVRIDELARRREGLFSAGTLTGIDTGILLGLIEHPAELSSTLIVGGRWRLVAAEAIDGELALQREAGDIRVNAGPLTALGLSRLALVATVTQNRLSAELDAAGTALGTISARANTLLSRQGGSIGLPGSAALSFEAAVDMPSLAWTSALTEGRMTIDGRLKGTFGGQGTVARPGLSGSIAADRLRVEIPAQGVMLKDGIVRATLSENSLLLDRILLKGGDGTLEGSGALVWENGKASARIALKAGALEVLRRLDRLLVLSGNAELRLEDRRVRVTSTLKADRGEILLPDTNAPVLSADVVVVGRELKPVAGKAPFQTDAELDIDLGERFVLKGRGIDARLVGGIKVRAVAGRPATGSGRISVAQGGYSAYGQRLVIDRGILTFSGPLDNPGLNIVALRKNLAVEAGVAITGTAQAPLIRLVSNPSVPDSEKLSWLVLGRGTLGTNRSDLGVLQAAAGALLARGESVLLQQRMAQAAGLDELSVSGTGGLETTVLTLGKRLSSNVYLSFEQGLATATNLVQITYTITPRISVRAQSGSDNAVDAFHTFSFR